jgi:hypothetical protein
MRKIGFALLLLTSGLFTQAASAQCGHVANETFYFQGHGSGDYFTVEHNFDVTDTTTNVVWALTYCLSLDDGQGGYQEYARTYYFDQDGASHLRELTGRSIDDNPSRIDNFDRFPLNATDINFYTIDDPNNTADDYIRFAIGLNDDTIVATLSASLKPYVSSCQ